MQRRITDSITRRSFALFTALVLSLSSVVTVEATDATRELQWSVHRLNAWLGGGEAAIGWRRYLLLNMLETQSAKGEQADIGQLGLAFSRFSGDVDGLTHPAFVEVKNALERQIQRLSASFRGDSSQMLMAHLGQYRPITVSSMAYERDRAKYDLLVLKRFYRNALPSRERANLFYDLQLDPMLDFLETIDFELAPEISVGKISSMIGDKRKLLKKVVREIDALPTADDNSDASDLSLDGPEESIDRPGPEEETPLDVLERRKQTLKAEIKQLTKSGKEVLAQDRPRLLRRRATLTKMRDLNDRFEKVARKRFDPYFASSAISFDRFVRRYANGTSDNLQENFLKRLQALAEDLPLLGDSNERRAAGSVGVHLAWLENAGQVPALITAIRARYSNPNLYLNLSSKLINQVAGQSIDDTRVLDENVGGRLIRGYARTCGNVSVDLIDDPNQAHLSIHLLGQLDSNTRFRQGKMYGFVNANGSFEARRSLYVNVGGMFAGKPYVAANVDTTFGGLTTKFDFIQKIARKQFAKGKAKADGGAARRTELESYEQFATLTDEAIGGGQDAIFEANQTAADYASWLPEMYIHTSREFLEAVAKKVSNSTLAAPDAPQATTVPADVVLRLHDSMLSNFADPIFAGKTFTNEQLAAEAARLTGETPADVDTDGEEAEGADDESFSITFDSVRPIQFEFEENAFTVSISGKKFSQGDREINAGLQIQIRFKIKRIDGKLKFVRDGDAILEYTNPDRKDAKIVAFKSFLEDKLNSEESAAADTAFDLPENLLPIEQMPRLKDNKIAKNLSLVQCRAEGGWLYLGWLHNNQSGSYAQVDIPAIWTEAVINQFDGNQFPEILPPIDEAIQVEGLIDAPNSAQAIPAQQEPANSGTGKISESAAIRSKGQKAESENVVYGSFDLTPSNI